MKTLIKASALFLDSASPWVCQIFNGDRPSVLFSPDPEPAPGGEDPPADPPPPPPPPEKKFSQADIDATAAKIRADERKKFADYETVKAQASKVTDLEKQLQDIRDEQENKGRSAEDKAKLEAQRAQRQIEKQKEESALALSEERGKRESAEKTLKELRLSIVLGTALDTAKVLPQAREKAIRAMQDDIKYEMDDEGNISSITYGGVLQKSMAEAATAFLRDNDFYASGGRPAGGGSKRPSGSGAPGGKKLEDMSIDELLVENARRDQAARAGTR